MNPSPMYQSVYYNYVLPINKSNSMSKKLIRLFKEVVVHSEVLLDALPLLSGQVEVLRPNVAHDAGPVRAFVRAVGKLADVWLIPGMDSLVLLLVRIESESFGTEIAGKRSNVQVELHVAVVIGSLRKQLIASRVLAGNCGHPEGMCIIPVVHHLLTSDGFKVAFGRGATKVARLMKLADMLV